MEHQQQVDFSAVSIDGGFWKEETGHGAGCKPHGSIQSICRNRTV